MFESVHGSYVLPVIRESVPLCHLCAEIYYVAAEQEVVLWCDHHGVPHEHSTVARKREGHSAGDDVWVFLCVHYGC